MIVEFFLDGHPPTTNHQSGRIIKQCRMFSKKRRTMVTVPTIVDSRELTLAKNTIEKWLWPHRLAAPMAAPVALVIEFTFPWTSEHSARARGRGRIPKATAPDVDNLAKTFKDRLQHLRFFAVDSHVVELTVRKWYGSRPGILVRLAPFEPTGDLFHPVEAAAPPSAASSGGL